MDHGYRHNYRRQHRYLYRLNRYLLMIRRVKRLPKLDVVDEEKAGKDPMMDAKKVQLKRPKRKR